MTDARRERLWELREELSRARTRDDLVRVARAFRALYPEEDAWDAVGMVAINVLRVPPPTRDEIEGADPAKQ